MEEKWIHSSTFLPYTGEPIEFLLEERDQPIPGTFTNSAFHSRWADYGIDQVQAWRGAEPAASPTASTAIPATTARTSSFIATLKRLLGMTSRSRNVIDGVPPRSHSRNTASLFTTIATPSADPMSRRTDSNQISS